MLFSPSVNVQDSVAPAITDGLSSATGEELNLRAIGQERNHVLLLTWDAQLPFSSPKRSVSYVGTFHPATKEFTKLYTFETQLNIRQCSLSPDGSLIAYTTYSDNKGNYSAFLAEVHNRIRTCIYSLNLQHDGLVQVKFLWPQRDRNSDHLARESKLLVFLHNKSIGLYTINLRRTGSSMVLHKLPIAEQVCGRFVWAQWDKLNQRLFILTSKTKNGRAKNTFKCLEYTSGGNVPAVPVMTMELPFNIKDHHSTERSGLENDPLSDIIAGGSLNLQVITQSQGVFCLCYQYILPRHRRLRKTISSPTLGRRPTPTSPPLSRVRVSVPEFPASESRGSSLTVLPLPTVEEVQFDLMSLSRRNQKPTVVDIDYTIFCVHNGTLISGTAHGVPEEEARGLKLYFGPQDGYILVYYPKVIQHLVNVTSEFSPCHHLAFSPVVENDDCVPTGDRLGNMTCEQTSPGGNCIYDIANQTAYQYSWMKPLPYQSLHPSLAKSVLHYLNIQARDNQTREEIMSHLTYDPTALNLQQYFLEFIMSSTYAAVRKQVEDRDIPRCFPFTAELSNPQLVMGRDQEKMATFASETHSCRVSLQEQPTERRPSNPAGNPYSAGNPYLFNRLKSHLADMRDRTSQARYSTKGLRARIDQIMEENMPNHSMSSSKEVPVSTQTPNSTLKWATESVMKKLTISGKRRRKQSSPSTKEHLATPEQTEEEWRYDRVQEAHIAALHEHLHGQLTHTSSAKLRQIATTYCTCQVQQLQNLINILIRSAGLEYNNNASVWDTSLNIRGSVQEQHLFMLMERLFVAIDTNCLLSSKDFQTQFACLGFRCLDFPTFLDYVGTGVLQLTREFLLKLLRDLSDDEKVDRDKTMKIINLLSNEKPLLAKELLVTWDHPEGNAALTKLYLEQVWFSDSARAGTREPEQPESPSATFPPLVSLLKYMQRFGKESTSSQPRQGVRLPASKIAAAAVYNSVQNHGEDMRGFSF